MQRNIAHSIQAYFANEDDGEFVCAESDAPWTVIAPLGSSGPVLLTTKPGVVVACLAESAERQRFNVVGRYGLPTPDGIDWIRKAFELDRLLFLGDLDPVDLLIFAWFREQLSPATVEYLGLNDVVLEQLGISSASSIAIPCESLEIRAFTLLNQVFPDVGEKIGSGCRRLLDSSRKIELEVLLSVKPAAVAMMQAALGR